MIITTTNTIEGKQIVEYKQLVFGEVVAGSNFIRDFFAGITDIIGGRSGMYESRITKSAQRGFRRVGEKCRRIGRQRRCGGRCELHYHYFRF